MERSIIKKIFLVIMIVAITIIVVNFTNSLLVRIDNLEENNKDLLLQLETVKEPFFYDLSNEYTDYYWIDPPYIRCKGIAFNAGFEDASNVILTINLWDPVGWLITSKSFELGDIKGRNYQNFDLNVEYFRKVDNITVAFEYE